METSHFFLNGPVVFHLIFVGDIIFSRRDLY